MSRKRIAIFGYNPLSFELAKRLDAELHDLVFIDMDAANLAIAAQQGFSTAAIDYRSDDDLKTIGIGTDVDSIFCFLPDDSENVFLTISARGIDTGLHIIATVENPESADKLLAAGANKIIDPYKISAQKIHQLLMKPEITKLIDHTVFGRHDLNIAEVEIPPGSCLEKTKTNELRLEQRYNLILIGVIDKELGDELHFAIDRTEHTLDTGDVLVILGPARDIRAFKKDLHTF
ncbi:MAG: potassium channel family protein [Gammaproteobacteria bacterium]